MENELVSDIYLDQACYRRKDLWEELKADIAKIHAAGKKAYYVFPSVFRKNTSDFYLGSLKKLNGCSVDGVVVKSLDAAWFVHRYLPQMPMILDQGLYTYNHRAQEILREFCTIRMTAPYELNRGELKKRDNADSEMVLYGYLPLMSIGAVCACQYREMSYDTRSNIFKRPLWKIFPGQK